MNSAMENSQKNSQKNNQRPSVIGETDSNVGGSDENRVSHEFRPQKDRFPRSVSEGPQVPIPKTFQVPPDAPIPEFVQVLRLNFALDQVSQPYQRRTNSRSRHHQLYYLTHKVEGLIPTERKTRPKKPIDYTEGQLPPGLTYEDLFKRCITPPSKRRRTGDTKSSPIFIFSSSGAEPHVQDVNTNNPFNEDEEHVHCGPQDELPHESDSMSMIDGASSHTLLEFASQITQSEGSKADNVANDLSQTCEIPATETQPESNEEPTANVASRANSGGELNMVSQSQNFSSDTVYFTASENFAMSDPPVLGQGVDGVNNETANGEISNSVENRARDLSEIKDSQFPPVNLPQPFNFLWPVDLLQSISSTMSSEQREALKRSLLARKEQIQAISDWISRERIEVEERLNNLE